MILLETRMDKIETKMDKLETKTDIIEKKIDNILKVTDSIGLHIKAGQTDLLLKIFAIVVGCTSIAVAISKLL